MKTMDVSHLKKMLGGANGKRLDSLAAGRVSRPHPPQIPQSRRAANKLLGALVDPAVGKQFAAVLKKDRAQREAIAKKSKSAAIKNSHATQKVLSLAMAQRMKDLQVLALDPPSVGSPEFHLLNIPSLIEPTGSVELDASAVVPSDSSAKFKFRTESNFAGGVRFHYGWTNPKDKFVVLNADGYAIFNGHLYCGVDGGTFPGDRITKISLDARLDIFQMWTDPPSQPIPQPDQSVIALTMQHTANGFFAVGAVEARDFFRGYDLRHTLLVVPPLATVDFAVTLTVNCTNRDGLTDVDFSSNAFRVGSPAVLLAVVS